MRPPEAEFEWTTAESFGPELVRYLERSRLALHERSRRWKDRSLLRDRRDWAIQLLAQTATERMVPVLLRLALDRAEPPVGTGHCLERLVSLGVRLERNEVRKLLRLMRTFDPCDQRCVLLLAERAKDVEGVRETLERLTPEARSLCLQQLEEFHDAELESVREWLYQRWLSRDRVALKGTPLFRPVAGCTAPPPMNGETAFATADRAVSRQLLSRLLPNGLEDWALSCIEPLYRQRPAVLAALASELGWAECLGPRLMLPPETLRARWGEQRYLATLTEAFREVLNRGRDPSEWKDEGLRAMWASDHLAQGNPQVAREVLEPLLLGAAEDRNTFELTWTFWEAAPDAALNLAIRGTRGEAPEWFAKDALRQIVEAPQPEHGPLIEWGLHHSGFFERTRAMLSLLRLGWHAPEECVEHSDSHSGIRLLQLGLKVKRHDRNAEQELLAAAEKGSTELQAAALTVLGELRERRYLPTFRKAIERHVDRPGLRVELAPARVACHYLARLATPAALTVLIRFALGADDDWVRRAARFDVENCLEAQGYGERIRPGVPHMFPFRATSPVTHLR